MLRFLIRISNIYNVKVFGQKTEFLARIIAESLKFKA
nr:MAG TPA: hypothetical protein [Caudoviricetes sp.]